MQGKRFDRSRFKEVPSQAAGLDEAELVRLRPWGERDLPLLAEPAVPDVDLAGWAAAERPRIESLLHRHGAILFRGFGITSAGVFEAFAASVCDELFDENGEHPREAVSGNVYTPVFYPPDRRLLWHNENSFNYMWPTRILFCCVRPAGRGGETPLADSREVYRRLEPALRRRFEEKGVLYMRHYGAGPGLDWRAVFGTGDRAEVEARCAREGFTAEWKEGGEVLRTRCMRPAVVRHPATGEPCWFNQAQHWHVACLDPDVREAILASCAQDDLPRSCSFGDGTPIEDSAMAEILGIYDEIEVAFPWQAGDVVLVDNVLAAHGRNAFTGERKILVALGDMRNYDDL